jgi:CHAT domain-containing protein
MAPSASAAVDLWERPRAGGPLRALALGDAVAPSLEGSEASDPAAPYRATFKQAGGLPRLGATAAEARTVSEFAPGAEVRLRDAASEAWLKRTPLEGYRLVHLASHAAVSEQSMARTALALAPGDGEDGFVGADEIAHLRLSADLVVLSACRTAGGVIVGGEGIQGLTSALVKAGARAVLATEWQVGDRAAARFTERFYRALAKGETAAQALRSARLASIAQGASPDEWAAFVLVGDSEVRLPLRAPRREALPLIAAMAVLILTAYGVMRSRRGRDATVRPS